MGEVGCLKDGHFQNLQVDGNADLSFGQAVTFKGTVTGDDNPVKLTLATGEIEIVAADKIGVIDFQAPDETTGTDAIAVCAGIEAVAEAAFTATANKTKLSFKTAASEAAAEKMSLTSAGFLTLTSGKIISGVTVGTIPDGGTTKITAALLLDHDLLNYASGTNVTGATWATGTEIDTALTAKGVTLAVGTSFDIWIQNSDNAAFVFGANAAGITSKSGAATNASGQIPVIATGLAGVGHFRFVRTGANAYDLYAIGLAAS